MVYKVYYQEHAKEVAVRERTKTLYIEATSEREVRKKLRDRDINIEYVEKVEGAYLQYETQNEDYKVLEI